MTQQSNPGSASTFLSVHSLAHPPCDEEGVWLLPAHVASSLSLSHTHTHTNTHRYKLYAYSTLTSSRMIQQRFTQQKDRRKTGEKGGEEYLCFCLERWRRGPEGRGWGMTSPVERGRREGRKRGEEGMNQCFLQVTAGKPKDASVQKR